MAVLINEGWVYFGDSSNNMLLYFEECKVDWKFKGVKIKHIAGKTNYFFTTRVRWLEFKFKKIYLTSHANLVTFLSYMEDWLDASGITLKVKRDASNFISFDGSNTSWTTALPEGGMRDIQKISAGDQDGPYTIGFLMLVEAG